MKEFEKIFTRAFAKRIAKYGFNKKKGSYIYRKTALGRCGVRLGFTKKIYGYDVRAYISVRFDRVEELVGLFPPNKFWKEISTLSTELGTLIDGEIRTWSVSLVEDEKLGNIYLAVLENVGLPKTDVVSDIELVLDEIIENIEVFGLPLLEKYCDSLEDTLFVVCKDDKDARSLCHSLGARAKTAITVAFLLNDKLAFQDIAKRKEVLLEKESHFELDNFRKLKAYLQDKMEHTEGLATNDLRPDMPVLDIY